MERAGVLLSVVVVATMSAVPIAISLRDRPGPTEPPPAPGVTCTPAASTNEVPLTVIPKAVTTQAPPADAFDQYVKSLGRGWTGGDSTYSVRLPDGRIVWLFSDTYLGPLSADGTRPVTAAMVNNTFVVQDGAELTTVHGGTARDPAAILRPQRRGSWYWMGDGLVTADGLLQVVFREYRWTGSGVLDIAFNSNVVATFRPEKLDVPMSINSLPSTGVAWGAAILPTNRTGDGYSYIYGVRTSGAGKDLRVARVLGSDLRRPWQYFSACGWGPAEAEALDILHGVSDEVSVVDWNGQFLLLSGSQTGLDPSIYGSAGSSPQGPFGDPTVLYTMPETGLFGQYRDADVVAYNPHIHPHLTAGDSIVVSYNVNSLDTAVDVAADTFRDPTIYRPRFIRLTLAPGPSSLDAAVDRGRS